VTGGGETLTALGDATLILELDDRMDAAVNARAVAIAHLIADARVAGVRDVVPTIRSVAIHFDPVRTDRAGLASRIREAASQASAVAAAPGRRIRVPVCYDDEFGPDLGQIAADAGLTRAEAVRVHTSRTYRVFMLGFLPGFAYLGVVDDRIAARRLATPRARVEAGSVGIAGRQTGVYPSAAPGGWRIIGRTPARPFDATRAEPFLFAPGDAVEFHAIDASAYERLAQVR
jgi:KipI family sensor histidine kinase inhibitor